MTCAYCGRVASFGAGVGAPGEQVSDEAALREEIADLRVQLRNKDAQLQQVVRGSRVVSRVHLCPQTCTHVHTHAHTHMNTNTHEYADTDGRMLALHFASVLLLTRAQRKMRP